MISTQEVFYTVKELAELLKVNPMTVYRLVKRKELGCHRIGRAIRFHRDEVERYLRDRRS
jgi:excisionase family DNA binding protein